MPEKTLIHPDKVRAYLATDYHIGQRSQRLAELFTASSVECGAFLTAYNPQGAIQSDAANERAHADLAALLHEQGIRALEGSGGEEDSDWPTEKSWFALGLQLEPAKDLGRHFDQDAIVWVDADAVPQLILLR